MLKVSGHQDRCSAQSFPSGDEIRGLGLPGNRQCRTLVKMEFIISRKDISHYKS